MNSRSMHNIHDPTFRRKDIRDDCTWNLIVTFSSCLTFCAQTSPMSEFGSRKAKARLPPRVRHRGQPRNAVRMNLSPWRSAPRGKRPSDFSVWWRRRGPDWSCPRYRWTGWRPLWYSPPRGTRCRRCWRGKLSAPWTSQRSSRPTASACVSAVFRLGCDNFHAVSSGWQTSGTACPSPSAPTMTMTTPRWLLKMSSPPADHVGSIRGHRASGSPSTPYCAVAISFRDDARACMRVYSRETAWTPRLRMIY